MQQAAVNPAGCQGLWSSMPDFIIDKDCQTGVKGVGGANNPGARCATTWAGAGYNPAIGFFSVGGWNDDWGKKADRGYLKYASSQTGFTISSNNTNDQLPQALWAGILTAVTLPADNRILILGGIKDTNMNFIPDNAVTSAFIFNPAGAPGSQWTDVTGVYTTAGTYASVTAGLVGGASNALAFKYQNGGVWYSMAIISGFAELDSPGTGRPGSKQACNGAPKRYFPTNKTILYDSRTNTFQAVYYMPHLMVNATESAANTRYTEYYNNGVSLGTTINGINTERVPVSYFTCSGKNAPNNNNVYAGVYATQLSMLSESQENTASAPTAVTCASDATCFKAVQMGGAKLFPGFGEGFEYGNNMQVLTFKPCFRTGSCGSGAPWAYWTAYRQGAPRIDSETATAPYAAGSKLVAEDGPVLQGQDLTPCAMRAGATERQPVANADWGGRYGAALLRVPRETLGTSVDEVFVAGGMFKRGKYGSHDLLPCPEARRSVLAFREKGTTSGDATCKVNGVQYSCVHAPTNPWGASYTGMDPFRRAEDMKTRRGWINYFKAPEGMGYVLNGGFGLQAPNANSKGEVMYFTKASLESLTLAVNHPAEEATQPGFAGLSPDDRMTITCPWDSVGNVCADALCCSKCDVSCTPVSDVSNVKSCECKSSVGPLMTYGSKNGAMLGADAHRVVQHSADQAQYPSWGTNNRPYQRAQVWSIPSPGTWAPGCQTASPYTTPIVDEHCATCTFDAAKDTLAMDIGNGKATALFSPLSMPLPISGPSVYAHSINGSTSTFYGFIPGRMTTGGGQWIQLDATGGASSAKATRVSMATNSHKMYMLATDNNVYEYEPTTQEWNLVMAGPGAGLLPGANEVGWLRVTHNGTNEQLAYGKAGTNQLYYANIGAGSWSGPVTTAFTMSNNVTSNRERKALYIRAWGKFSGQELSTVAFTNVRQWTNNTAVNESGTNPINNTIDYYDGMFEQVGGLLKYIHMANSKMASFTGHGIDLTSDATTWAGATIDHLDIGSMSAGDLFAASSGSTDFGVLRLRNCVKSNTTACDSGAWTRLASLPAALSQLELVYIHEDPTNHNWSPFHVTPHKTQFCSTSFVTPYIVRDIAGNTNMMSSYGHMAHFKDDPYNNGASVCNEGSGTQGTIVSGTYGGNIAGITEGNKTSYLQSDISGKGWPYTYYPYYVTIGDPAPGQAKTYTAKWTCPSDPTSYCYTACAEAGLGSTPISITCDSGKVACSSGGAGTCSCPASVCGGVCGGTGGHSGGGAGTISIFNEYSTAGADTMRIVAYLNNTGSAIQLGTHAGWAAPGTNWTVNLFPTLTSGQSYTFEVQDVPYGNIAVPNRSALITINASTEIKGQDYYTGTGGYFGWWIGWNGSACP